IFYYGASGGSVEANLARWAGQMNQPDGSDSMKSAKIEKREINRMKTTTLKLNGTFLKRPFPMSRDVVPMANYRMLASVMQSEVGPFFFKVVGPRNTIDHWDKSVDAFLNSVKVK
ncbi:MAG: hypothetical protein QF886_22705, partial [Planctomycetota bacterium]|nr:hypothetical protein [Planctomycetota bacterium]